MMNNLIDSQQITIRGHTDTIIGHCERAGVNLDRVIKRLRKLDPDDAIYGIKPTPTQKGKVHTVGGITDTLKGHARRTGQNLDTIKYRLRQGQDLETALSTPPRRTGRKRKMHTVRGVTDTLDGHARRAGRNPRTVRGRRKIMSLEDALYGPWAGARDSHQVIIDGINDTVAGHARRVGIHPSTVFRRMKHLSISLEEALKLKRYESPVKRGQRYTVDGISDTVSGHAQRVGINLETVRYRMRQRRMSLIDALYHPRYQHQKGGS